MSWFIREVFPIILAKIPEAHLTITGDPANQSLPPNTQITHAGFVEDVRPYISRASCSIVPLHTGGGTRLKILEAMALGTPVVSTSKGAEGLNVQHGIHLLIADEPAVYANAVIQILEDHDFRKRIAENAYGLLNNQYSSKVIIPHYLDLIENTKKSIK
jgi:glycosyltransferase involved in cell wall biosynthesis